MINKDFIVLVFLIGLPFLQAQNQVDILIIGGGVRTSAGIQAARMGVKVHILRLHPENRQSHRTRHDLLNYLSGYFKIFPPEFIQGGVEGREYHKNQLLD